VNDACEQRSEDSSQAGSATPSGVPGATSNEPPLPASAPINGAAQVLQGAQGGTTAGTGRREAETKYEVDKTTRWTKNATGNVRRLNAAVVVNHRVSTDPKGKAVSTPLTTEELDKLTALVEQGIGFNKERGDSVRVINAPFRIEAVPPVEPVPLWMQPWLQDMLRAGAAPGALALVALVIVFTLIRPALRAVLAPPPPVKGEQLDEVVAGDDALPALAAPDGVAALTGPDNNARLDGIRAMAKDNPAAVANIVRGWVNGEPA
jgi:flagellar M-ring protein FliF